MIVALAGRRIDALGAKDIRFPLSNADEVKEKLKALFISLKPAALVSSAACGADLLALQVADKLNIQRAIVLPFDQQLFKSTSVTDRPGDWGELYDQVCQAVINEEGINVLNYSPDDPETYRQTNVDILETAMDLGRKHDSKNFTAVIVWEGKPKDEDDTTEHFRNEATRSGFKIFEIITSKN